MQIPALFHFQKCLRCIRTKIEGMVLFQTHLYACKTLWIFSKSEYQLLSHHSKNSLSFKFFPHPAGSSGVGGGGELVIVRCFTRQSLAPAGSFSFWWAIRRGRGILLQTTW